MTKEQFISLANQSQEALRRFLTALCCGDSTHADDIAQEAFIKAYLSLHTLRDEKSFKSWLYRIGYNTFLNTNRSRTPTTGYEDAAQLPSPDAADAKFRYQALHLALSRLSPAERTSILLFYMEDYSIKEIAEIEKVSPDSVKQHLSRGRRHLRHLLTPKDNC